MPLSLTKLLVIDDDKEFRQEGVIDFWTKWAHKPIDYVWFVAFPEDLLEYLIDNPDIDCISFDNDLGLDNVSHRLNKLVWEDVDKFRKAFANRTVVIHSMNPPAADRIYTLLKHFAKQVKIIPFALMLPAPETSESY